MHIWETTPHDRKFMKHIGQYSKLVLKDKQFRFGIMKILKWKKNTSSFCQIFMSKKLLRIQVRFRYRIEKKVKLFMKMALFAFTLCWVTPQPQLCLTKTTIAWSAFNGEKRSLKLFFIEPWKIKSCYQPFYFWSSSSKSGYHFSHTRE